MSKIYYRGKSRNHCIFVQPGVDYPEKKEWHEIDGRAKAFEIRFINNESEVDDSLADYLVMKGLAHASPIIQLNEVA